MNHGDMDHGDGGHGGHGGHGGGSMPMCNMNVRLSIPIHPSRQIPPIYFSRTKNMRQQCLCYTLYCRNAVAVVYRGAEAVECSIFSS